MQLNKIHPYLFILCMCKVHTCIYLHRCICKHHGRVCILSLSITHTHTHQLCVSRAFCTSLQPFSQHSGPRDMLLLYMCKCSRVRKINSCSFQYTNPINPLVIQGDFPYLPPLHASVLFLFIWELPLPPSRIYWSVCLSLKNCLGQTHVLAADLHPLPAICKTEGSGPVRSLD